MRLPGADELSSAKEKLKRAWAFVRASDAYWKARMDKERMTLNDVAGAFYDARKAVTEIPEG
jgi:hypothetical protein